MDGKTLEEYNKLRQELQSAKEGAAACGQLTGIYINIQSEFEKFCREHNIPLVEN